jgi:flagellar protein FliO/FliZ
MWDLLYWIVMLSVLAAIAIAAIVGVRAYMSGTSPGEVLFKQRPEPRLSVIEHANVDGKRKLLLIRRDDVEHLIMTGGPVDVVLETGIGEKRRPVAEPVTAAATVFTRPARTLGQSSGGAE